MTTLYFTNTSCSKAAFIANKISGANFATDGVTFDWSGSTYNPATQTQAPNHKTKSGKMYATIIPKGNVPGVAMADGTILSEGVAVHSAIADAAPSSNILGGPAGSSERLAALERFSFIATDIHAGSIYSFYTPLVANPETREFFTKKLQGKFAFIASYYLAGGKKSFFEGKVTSPDLYLSWCIEAAKGHGIDVGADMEAFLAHTCAIPAVKAAIDEANAAFA